MYSYGITLIEIFTKKKPTCEIFCEEMSLKNWVNDLLPISVMNAVNTNLLTREDKYFAAKEQCVSSVLSLAMNCTSEAPEMRINTKEIVTRLKKIRDALFANIKMEGE